MNSETARWHEAEEREARQESTLDGHLQNQGCHRVAPLRRSTGALLCKHVHQQYQYQPVKKQHSFKVLNVARDQLGWSKNNDIALRGGPFPLSI